MFRVAPSPVACNAMMRESYMRLIRHVLDPFLKSACTQMASFMVRLDGTTLQ